MASDARDGALAGASELFEKLGLLGALDSNKIPRGMVRAGMNETKKLAETRIPVGTRLHRTYKGRLVSPGFGKRSLRIVTTSRTDSGRIAALLGVRQEAYYEVQFLERGTSKIKPHPWLRSSFYDTKTQQERAMVAYMQKWLTKIAAGGKP